LVNIFVLNRGWFNFLIPISPLLINLPYSDIKTL
jgi:hypothetical protein